VEQLQQDRGNLLGQMNSSVELEITASKKYEELMLEKDRQLRESSLEDSKKDNEILQMSNKIKSLMSHNDKLRDLLKQKDNRNDDFDKTCLDMESDITRLLSDNTKLETLLLEEEKKYSELKLDFVNVENKYSLDFSKNVANLTRDNEHLTRENKKLQNSNSEQSKELDAWKRRYNDVEGSLKRKNEGYELEMKNYMTKFETLKNNLRAMEESNDSLSMTLRSLEDRNGSMAQDLKRCADEESRLNDNIIDLERMLKDKKIDNERNGKEHLLKVGNMEHLLGEERVHCDIKHRDLEDTKNKLHCVTIELKKEQSICLGVQSELEEVILKNRDLEASLQDQID
jgi:chromosome segregation ATPase